MASNVSKMGICNLALGWLRATIITNFETDQSATAVLCRENYDRVREAVLEDREWRFATGRLKLALHADAPEFGYANQFAIPASALRVLTVSSKQGLIGVVGENDIEWEREGDFVLTNSEYAYAKCTMNEETVSRFSPGFVQAFATRLAAEMAVALTGSNSRHDNLMADYQIKLVAGSTRDGMQGKAKRRRPGRLQTARYRGGSGFDVIVE